MTNDNNTNIPSSSRDRSVSPTQAIGYQPELIEDVEYLMADDTDHGVSYAENEEILEESRRFRALHFIADAAIVNERRERQLTELSELAARTLDLASTLKEPEVLSTITNGGDEFVPELPNPDKPRRTKGFVTSFLTGQFKEWWRRGRVDRGIQQHVQDTTNHELTYPSEINDVELDSTVLMVSRRTRFGAAAKYGSIARLELNPIIRTQAMEGAVRNYLNKLFEERGVRYVDRIKLMPASIEFAFAINAFELEAAQIRASRTVILDHEQMNTGFHSRESPGWFWWGRKLSPEPTRTS